MSDIKIKTAKTFPSNSGNVELDEYILNINVGLRLNVTGYESNEAQINGGLPLKGINQIQLDKLKAKKKILPLIGQKLIDEGKDIDYDFILEAIWLHEDQTIRVFLFHKDQTTLTFDGIGTEDPKRGLQLLTYVIENDIIVVEDDEGIWFYLTELLPAHQAILEEFNAIIQNKPE